MRIFLALCMFVAVLSSNAFAKEWYEGGNLHGATVAQWSTANDHNRVATSADWVHVTTDKNIIAQMTRQHPESLHQLAIFLSACVTKSADGLAGNVQVSTLAVLCLATFKEQNPNLSWLLSKTQ